MTFIDKASFGNLSGAIYEGEMKMMMPTHGTTTFKNGDKYIGNYKGSKQHGQGTYTHADGKIEKGIWKDGELIKKQ